MKKEIKYLPKIRQKTYATTREEQRRQLANDDLIRQFATSRPRLIRQRNQGVGEKYWNN